MTKEEAMATIARLVDEAERAIAQAEAFADEHGLEFGFSPAYGMGGTYNGNKEHRWLDQGWNPSSMSC